MSHSAEFMLCWQNIFNTKHVDFFINIWYSIMDQPKKEKKTTNVFSRWMGKYSGEEVHYSKQNIVAKCMRWCCTMFAENFEFLDHKKIISNEKNDEVSSFYWLIVQLRQLKVLASSMFNIICDLPSTFSSGIFQIETGNVEHKVTKLDWGEWKKTCFVS